MVSILAVAGSSYPLFQSVPRVFRGEPRQRNLPADLEPVASALALAKCLSKNAPSPLYEDGEHPGLLRNLVCAVLDEAVVADVVRELVLGQFLGVR